MESANKDEYGSYDSSAPIFWFSSFQGHSSRTVLTYPLVLDVVKFVFFFFFNFGLNSITILLRDDSHTIKFTLFKCTIQ